MPNGASSHPGPWTAARPPSATAAAASGAPARSWAVPPSADGWRTPKTGSACTAWSGCRRSATGPAAAGSAPSATASRAGPGRCGPAGPRARPLGRGNGLHRTLDVQSRADYLIMMRLVAYAGGTVVALDRAEHFSARPPPFPFLCMDILHQDRPAATHPPAHPVPGHVGRHMVRLPKMVGKPNSQFVPSSCTGNQRQRICNSNQQGESGRGLYTSGSAKCIWRKQSWEHL